MCINILFFFLINYTVDIKNFKIITYVEKP